MLMRMWSDWDGCKIAMRYCHTSMSFQKGVLLQWQTIFHTTRGFWNQWRMIWTMCFIKSVHWKPEYKSNTQMHSKTLLLLWTLMIDLISMLPSDAMFLNSLCNVQKNTCIPQIDVVSVLLRVTSYSGLDTQFFVLVKEHQLIWRCKVHTCNFSNWCAINGAVA